MYYIFLTFLPSLTLNVFAPFPLFQSSFPVIHLINLSSCSYYAEKKSRRGKTPVSRTGGSGSGSSPTSGSGSDLFIVSAAMIAEKLRVLKQSEGAGAQELSRYMVVYFDYSTENDIPTMLSLAPR